MRAFLRTHPTAKDGLKYDAIIHTLKLESVSGGTTWFKKLLLATHLLETDQPHHLPIELLWP